MAPSPNKILSRVSKADLRLLEAHLVAVDLPLRTQLSATNKRVEHIYFIESGIASVVANGETAVGIIGREGVTGAGVIMGNGKSVPHEIHMQIAGSGQRISTEQIRKAVAASAPLHDVLRVTCARSRRRPRRPPSPTEAARSKNAWRGGC